MKCPGCDHETASTVHLFFRCGWQAADLAEVLAPPPPPTGLSKKVKAGIALIALSALATAISYAMAWVHGGSEYGIFVGGAGAGLILIIRGFDERRRELDRRRGALGSR